MQALQSVGMMLLAAGQLLGHHPPSGEMLKIHSVKVVKQSLAEHRTDLFRFHYPNEGECPSEPCGTENV